MQKILGLFSIPQGCVLQFEKKGKEQSQAQPAARPTKSKKRFLRKGRPSRKIGWIQDLELFPLLPPLEIGSHCRLIPFLEQVVIKVQGCLVTARQFFIFLFDRRTGLQARLIHFDLLLQLFLLSALLLNHLAVLVNLGSQGLDLRGFHGFFRDSFGRILPAIFSVGNLFL